MRRDKIKLRHGSAAKIDTLTSARKLFLAFDWVVFAVGGCACFDVFDWLLVNAFDGDGVRDLRNTAQKRAQRPGLTGTCVAPNAPKIQTSSKKYFGAHF